MRQLFGKIWLIWSAKVFLFSMPWVWLSYQWIKLTKKKDAIYQSSFAVSNLWGKYVLFFLGVKVNVFNQQYKANNQQVIYVSNHRSQIDIPINFVTTPQFVILSKIQAAKIPVVGTNLRLAHETVDRKSKESRKNALLNLKEHLRAGRSLLLYPEGRRTREDIPLGDFHDGAFSLAKEFQLPIVPVVIMGSEQINNPKQPFAIFPGTVNVYFEEAIIPSQSDSVQSLKERTKIRMQERITQ